MLSVKWLEVVKADGNDGIKSFQMVCNNLPTTCRYPT